MTFDEQGRLVDKEIYSREEAVDNLSSGPKYEAPGIVPGAPGYWARLKEIDIGDIDRQMTPGQYSLDDVAMDLAAYRLKNSFTQDIHVTQAVRSIDDINKIMNLFAERVREWYGYSMPEIKNAPDEKVVPLIAQGLDKKALLDEMGGSDKSFGCDYEPYDEDTIRKLSGLYEQCLNTRDELGSYVEEKVKELAPNLTNAVGPIIASRLIDIAGSLKDLARMPSSTIQVLGAENALFKHLQSGKRPPKHGILFQHLWVHGAPKNKRGKIARAMASKAAIAARLDYFGNGEINDTLVQELKKRINDIMNK